MMKRSVGWVGVLMLPFVATACTPARPLADQVTISFHYSHFEPSQVRVPVGVPVTITLRNDDPIGHEWIVGPPSIHAIHRVGTEPYHGGRPDEVSLPPYSTRTTTLTFDSPVTFAYICHLPGHEAYGMRGELSAELLYSHTANPMAQPVPASVR